MQLLSCRVAESSCQISVLEDGQKIQFDLQFVPPLVETHAHVFAAFRSMLLSPYPHHYMDTYR